MKEDNFLKILRDRLNFSIFAHFLEICEIDLGEVFIYSADGSPQALSDEYLLAKFSANTAEKKPLQVQIGDHSYHILGNMPSRCSENVAT